MNADEDINNVEAYGNDYTNSESEETFSFESDVAYEIDAD